MRNCPDVTILINLFGQDQSQGTLVVRVVGVVGWSGGSGSQGHQGGQVRVILSDILKWQRFLEVISRFLEVISRFLEVISWFLEVISTRGRYRAARAAKKIRKTKTKKRVYYCDIRAVFLQKEPDYIYITFFIRG